MTGLVTTDPFSKKGRCLLKGVLDYELLVCPKGGQNSRNRFQREMGHSDPQVKLVAKMNWRTMSENYRHYYGYAEIALPLSREAESSPLPKQACLLR